jgi:hypothetical protein
MSGNAANKLDRSHAIMIGRGACLQYTYRSVQKKGTGKRMLMQEAKQQNWSDILNLNRYAKYQTHVRVPAQWDEPTMEI